MKYYLKNNRYIITLLIAILAISFSYGQFDIPPKPSFQTSVYDYANILAASEKQQLENKLIRYSDSTTTQIVVVTIESLKGENIDMLSTNWAQKWGIGDAEKDNGVIILLSKNDKKISIRPGYGVEDRLVAGICGEIIRKIIIPEFKLGSYYNGLDKGTTAVIEVLKGKYKGVRKGNKNGGGEGFMIILVIIFFVVLIIIAKNRNNRGGNSGNGGGMGMDLLDVIILSNLGRGGFGGSSSGGFGSSDGGGFGGGFGGGGFSGGGASGSWE